MIRVPLSIETGQSLTAATDVILTVIPTGSTFITTIRAGPTAADPPHRPSTPREESVVALDDDVFFDEVMGD